MRARTAVRIHAVPGPKLQLELLRCTITRTVPKGTIIRMGTRMGTAMGWADIRTFRCRRKE